MSAKPSVLNNQAQKSKLQNNPNAVAGGGGVVMGLPSLQQQQSKARINAKKNINTGVNKNQTQEVNAGGPSLKAKATSKDVVGMRQQIKAESDAVAVASSVLVGGVSAKQSQKKHCRCNIDSLRNQKHDQGLPGQASSKEPSQSVGGDSDLSDQQSEFKIEEAFYRKEPWKCRDEDPELNYDNDVDWSDFCEIQLVERRFVQASADDSSSQSAKNQNDELQATANDHKRENQASNCEKEVEQTQNVPKLQESKIELKRAQIALLDDKFLVIRRSGSGVRIPPQIREVKGSYEPRHQQQHDMQYFQQPCEKGMPVSLDVVGFNMQQQQENSKPQIPSDINQKQDDLQNNGSPNQNVSFNRCQAPDCQIKHQNPDNINISSDKHKSEDDQKYQDLRNQTCKKGLNSSNPSSDINAKEEKPQLRQELNCQLVQQLKQSIDNTPDVVSQLGKGRQDNEKHLHNQPGQDQFFKDKNQGKSSIPQQLQHQYRNQVNNQDIRRVNDIDCDQDLHKINPAEAKDPINLKKSSEEHQRLVAFVPARQDECAAPRQDGDPHQMNIKVHNQWQEEPKTRLGNYHQKDIQPLQKSDQRAEQVVNHNQNCLCNESISDFSMIWLNIDQCEVIFEVTKTKIESRLKVPEQSQQHDESMHTLSSEVQRDQLSALLIAHDNQQSMRNNNQHERQLSVENSNLGIRKNSQKNQQSSQDQMNKANENVGENKQGTAPNGRNNSTSIGVGANSNTGKIAELSPQALAQNATNNNEKTQALRTVSGLSSKLGMQAMSSYGQARRESQGLQLKPAYLTTYLIKIKPYQRDITWASYLEFTLHSEADYLRLKQLMTYICLIAWPTLDKEYSFIENLGKGSQASVDLYREKTSHRSNINKQHRSNSAVNYQLLGNSNNCAPQFKQSFAANNFGNNGKIPNQLFAINSGKGNLPPPPVAAPVQDQYAVKKYKINIEETDYYFRMVLQEIKYLRELKICENIVALKQVYISRNDENPTDVTVSLVMKYAKYGSILKYLQKKKRFTEEQIRTVMAQLILAVDLMHRKNIIHRDIKPDNILVMDKAELLICISDLGLACRADNKKEINQKCGTPGYVAPEVLRNHTPFTTKADIFSVGCFFFNMLTGANLFPGRNARDILLANRAASAQGPAIARRVTNVSQECKDLLVRMLNSDPTKRPTAEECIQHEWFSKDRQALQGSLFLNKNQQLIANLFNVAQTNIANQGIEQLPYNDCTSFIYAPNYYELVQCLSSSKMINLANLSSASGNGSSSNQQSISPHHSSGGNTSGGGGGGVGVGPNPSSIEQPNGGGGDQTSPNYLQTNQLNRAPFLRKSNHSNSPNYKVAAAALFVQNVNAPNQENVGGNNDQLKLGADLRSAIVSNGATEADPMQIKSQCEQTSHQPDERRPSNLTPKVNGFGGEICFSGLAKSNNKGNLLAAAGLDEEQKMAILNGQQQQQQMNLEQIQIMMGNQNFRDASMKAATGRNIAKGSILASFAKQVSGVEVSGVSLQNQNIKIGSPSMHDTFRSAAANKFIQNSRKRGSCFSPSVSINYNQIIAQGREQSNNNSTSQFKESFNCEEKLAKSLFLKGQRLIHKGGEKEKETNNDRNTPNVSNAAQQHSSGGVDLTAKLRDFRMQRQNKHVQHHQLQNQQNNQQEDDSSQFNPPSPLPLPDDQVDASQCQQRFAANGQPHEEEKKIELNPQTKLLFSGKKKEGGKFQINITVDNCIEEEQKVQYIEENKVYVAKSELGGASVLPYQNNEQCVVAEDNKNYIQIQKKEIDCLSSDGYLNQFDQESKDSSQKQQINMPPSFIQNGDRMAAVGERNKQDGVADQIQALLMSDQSNKANEGNIHGAKSADQKVLKISRDKQQESEESKINSVPRSGGVSSINKAKLEQKNLRSGKNKKENRQQTPSSEQIIVFDEGSIPQEFFEDGGSRVFSQDFEEQPRCGQFQEQNQPSAAFASAGGGCGNAFCLIGLPSNPFNQPQPSFANHQMHLKDMQSYMHLHNESKIEQNLLVPSKQGGIAVSQLKNSINYGGIEDMPIRVSNFDKRLENLAKKSNAASNLADKSRLEMDLLQRVTIDDVHQGNRLLRNMNIRAGGGLCTTGNEENISQIQ